MSTLEKGGTDCIDASVRASVPEDGIAVKVDDDTIAGDNSLDEHAEGQEEVDTGFKELSGGASAPNIYVGKRNFIHQLMDVALLMANVSQLKALLVSQNNDYFYLLLAFICLSISLQIIFTICMLAIWSIEKKLETKVPDVNIKHGGRSRDDGGLSRDDAGLSRDVGGLSRDDGGLSRDEEGQKAWAELLDKMGNVLVLFIIVSNVFITGFGVQDQHVEKEDRTEDPGSPLCILGNGSTVFVPAGR